MKALQKVQRGLVYILPLCLTVCYLSDAQFNVKYIDKGDSRLIATSLTNYAMTGAQLAVKGWKTVSVNGDQVLIITTSGDRLTTSKTALEETDRQVIESLRDELIKRETSRSLATDYIESEPVALRASSRSSSSSSASFSSTLDGVTTSVRSEPNYQSNEMSISMRDKDNFSIAKSNLPFNWAKVFFNGDLITMVKRDGTVLMEPMTTLDSTLKDPAEKLRAEVLDGQQGRPTQQAGLGPQDIFGNSGAGNSRQPPMNPFFGPIFGNVFGNNYPYGMSSSPYGPALGWPYGPTHLAG